jgi:hypothetical protein
MNAVTSGNLIISSDLNISEIQEFDMRIEKNCHTVVRIAGSVPDETGESPVFQKLEGSSVTVSDADSRKFAGTENPWNGTERGTYSR